MDGNVEQEPQNSDQIASPAKVTHDPGWNDPPLMSYDDTRSPSTSLKKSILNKPKRIAFPLGSNSQTQINSDQKLGSSMGLPPRCVPPLRPTVAPVGDDSTVPSPFSLPPLGLYTPPVKDTDHTASKSMNQTTNNTVTSKSTVLPIITESSLRVVMEVLEDSALKAFEGNEKDGVEINKRLMTMKKMWEEDKLDLVVKQRMLQLSEALSSGQGNIANDIQVALSVDHSSQCRTWMAGVRKLVHQVVTMAENDTSCNNEETTKRCEGKVSEEQVQETCDEVEVN